MDVGATAQLLRHLLFGSGLIANETDDSVVGVAGRLAKELELLV